MTPKAGRILSALVGALISEAGEEDEELEDLTDTITGFDLGLSDFQVTVDLLDDIIGEFIKRLHAVEQSPNWAVKLKREVTDTLRSEFRGCYTAESTARKAEELERRLDTEADNLGPVAGQSICSAKSPWPGTPPCSRKRGHDGMHRTQVEIGGDSGRLHDSTWANDGSSVPAPPPDVEP